MERKKEPDNVLRQALERRQVGGLPSNFSFRMMERVRHEALKQQRHRERVLLFSMIGVLVVMIGLLIGYFILYSDIQWSQALPKLELTDSASPLWSFYVYIAGLALLLLGGDYWLRKKKQKS